jgi:phospholipid transport system substrate-binding protein
MKIKFCGLITALFAIYIALSAGILESHADEVSDSAQNFIESVATKAQDALFQPTLSVAEQQNHFRKLMLENFDLDFAGKWAVGRYWRRIAEKERAEFISIFKDFIVATYTQRFRAYTKTKLEVTGSTIRQRDTFVNSQINRDGAKPIRIIWRVNFSDGRYKIRDVIIEGVSWIQTQRSEFVSVIRNNGGKVSGLIDALSKKITYLNSSPN